MSARKPMDISELYDELKKLGGTYVLSIDICDFAKINDEYGYAAGDIVIAETFARIERELESNMLLFRIGGDEFAVVTAYTTAADAEVLARKITHYNGTTVEADSQVISLSLRVGVSQIPSEALNYHTALESMNQSIEHVRNSGDPVAMYMEVDNN